jgi:hypothetical protein
VPLQSSDLLTRQLLPGEAMSSERTVVSTAQLDRSLPSHVQPTVRERDRAHRLTESKVAHPNYMG